MAIVQSLAFRALDESVTMTPISVQGRLAAAKWSTWCLGIASRAHCEVDGLLLSLSLSL